MWALEQPELLFCEQLCLIVPQRCEAQTARKVVSGLFDLIQPMLHRLERPGLQGRSGQWKIYVENSET